MPFLRTEFNYNMMEASNQSGLKCEDQTLTQQQFKEECDINTIVERFKLTGQMPQIETPPTYSDYEGIFDFQDAMNVIRAAQEQFMTLPANVRARFHNQPQEFLEFCENQDNADEAHKLGLTIKPTSDGIEAATQPQPPKGQEDGSSNQKSTGNPTQK